MQHNSTLFLHYFEEEKDDIPHITWNNIPREANLEDGAIVLDPFEDEISGDCIHAIEMPPNHQHVSNGRRFPFSFTMLSIALGACSYSLCSM